MRATVVLGPSRWAGEKPGVPEPLALRRRICQRMATFGIQATILEDHGRRRGEQHFRRFLHLIEEMNIEDFVVFWPMAARLHGLEVEFGHLLTRLGAGTLDARDIHLLVETRNARDPENIVQAVSEPGNRTRYHEDLVAAGCSIWPWESWVDLETQLSAVAFEILGAQG